MQQKLVPMGPAAARRNVQVDVVKLSLKEGPDIVVCGDSVVQLRDPHVQVAVCVFRCMLTQFVFCERMSSM